MALSGGRHFSNLYGSPPSDVYKPPDLVIKRPEMSDVFNPYAPDPQFNQPGPHKYPIAGKKKKEEHEYGSLNGGLDMMT
jgi:hypothetical protein